METYNWIEAYYHEAIVKIRQVSKGSATFVDGAENEFDISELDFTRNTFEPQIIPVEKTEGLKWLLESMDANSIADHKAKIDEREYWRKLRGEIFKMVFDATPDDRGTMEGVLEYTKKYFDAIYNQDQEFIKDK